MEDIALVVGLYKNIKQVVQHFIKRKMHKDLNERVIKVQNVENLKLFQL